MHEVWRSIGPYMRYRGASIKRGSVKLPLTVPHSLEQLHVLPISKDLAHNSALREHFQRSRSPILNEVLQDPNDEVVTPFWVPPG
jgi:hypothetical protein